MDRSSAATVSLMPRSRASAAQASDRNAIFNVRLPWLQNMLYLIVRNCLHTPLRDRPPENAAA